MTPDKTLTLEQQATIRFELESALAQGCANLIDIRAWVENLQQAGLWHEAYTPLRHWLIMNRGLHPQEEKQ